MYKILNFVYTFDDPKLPVHVIIAGKSVNETAKIISMILWLKKNQTRRSFFTIEIATFHHTILLHNVPKAFSYIL